MSDTPWVKFFSSDWLGGTSGLTAAERGVYITLCALMYEHDGPIALDEGRLARRCGCPKASFRKILAALVDEEKIILADGHLTNPKCEKEISDRAKRSEKARAVAHQRWNAQSEKTQQKQRGENASAMLAQCEPEPEPDKKATPSTPIPPNRFDEFWSLCPVKSGKPAAKKNFAKAIKAGHDPQAIIDGMKRYAEWLIAMGPSAPTTKYPQGWLTDERWSDELPPIPQHSLNNTNGARDGQLASLAGWAEERFGNRAEAGTGMVSNEGSDSAGEVLPARGGSLPKDDSGGLVRGSSGSSEESARDGLFGMAQIIPLPADNVRNPKNCHPDRGSVGARPAQPALAVRQVMAGGEHDGSGLDGYPRDCPGFADRRF
jgi:uncharacterized protein YdaU (DUF1376 family)